MKAIARLWRGAVLVTVVAAGVSLSSAPSHAAGRTVPPGDGLFTVACNQGVPNGQLLSVDSSSGSSLRIGPGNPAENSDCGVLATWDQATDTAYVEYANTAGSYYTVNLATGISAFAFNPSLNGVPVPYDDFNTIGISPDGVGYALVDTTLYTVNLATGAMTLLGPCGSIDDDVYSLAVDPITGVMYGLSESENDLYTFDTSTGAATLVTTLTMGAGDTTSDMQFDSNGTMWVLTDVANKAVEADLWSFDPTAADISASGQDAGALSEGSSDYFAWPLIEAPASAPTQFVSASTATATTGHTFSFTVKANGWAYPTYSIVAGALPEGLSLGSQTGTISGTPTTAGTFPVAVRASNSTGTVTQKLTLTVAPVLATTGVDPNPAAAGSLGLLVVGTALAAVAVIRRRRTDGRQQSPRSQ